MDRNNLEESIIARIETLDARKSARNFFVGTSGIILSSIGLWYGIYEILEDLHVSGFSQYISVVFSDSDAVVMYWKEFVFLVAESFPLMSALTILSMTLLFLGSIRSAFRGVRRTPVHLSFIR